MKTLFATLRSLCSRALRPYLIGLPLGLAAMISPARAQDPLTLDAITRTTNGVRLAWTDPATNQVYTVQIRNSLSGGAWRDATTRYRWPWPFQQWADVPVSLPPARYYRVLARTAAEPQRGKLLTTTSRGQNSTNSLNALFRESGYSGFVQPRFGTTAWAYTYETVDPYGLPIVASALLLLPIGTNGPLPLLSMQHGTLHDRAYAPSQPGGRELLFPSWAYVFASRGYAVVVPDYLGLGVSPGYQAYLHAPTEATCVVDALRVGRSLCASNKVTLNGQLFLTGYSQGGHVTMAAHQELESHHAQEFPVTASAPCAGGYDLGGVTIDGLLASRDYPGSGFFAIMLAAYLPIYQLGGTLEEMLAEPYRRTLPPLLDGAHGIPQVNAALPTDAPAILRPDFQADFRTNVNNPLRQALLRNNTHAWTPRAPVRMIHCRGDDIVTYANAEVAYQSFTNRGACCVSIVDPGAPARLNHDDCYTPSLREALTWFETLRQ